MKAALAVGFAALTLGGAALIPAPAEAGASTGTWRNGMVAGPRGIGFRGGGYGYRGGGYGYRGANFGYRGPGFGYRGAGYGYRPAYGYGYRPYYRNRSNYGGAVAAGLLGGLALGAIASAPAYSYPAYSYPAYPSYYGGAGYGAPACYTVRRRYVDYWGRVVIRRTQVCE